MNLEKTIRDRARLRVAQVFGLAPEAVSSGAEFGNELKASFVSDFKDNEFDKILQDIQDVADGMTRKRLESGELVIRTVGDYCNHMVRCYEKKPEEVSRLLGLKVG